jgi:hypothetical protein
MVAKGATLRKSSQNTAGPDYSGIEGRAWRSEGTETNSFNGVFGAWLVTGIFPRRSLYKLSLQAAPRHRPIAFAPEGSPFDPL